MKPRDGNRATTSGTRQGALPWILVTLLAACSGDPGNDVRREHYNVLLISLDSTRRDLLGSYGHVAPHAPERSSSPHLDRLAAEGVLMEDAYATTSWTLPSHVSLMTGVPELVHGVDFDTHEPDPRRAVLAEVLADAGYRTAGFFSGPYLDARFGFDRGFERYEACYGTSLREAAKRMEAANRRVARLEERGDDPTRVRQAKQHAAQVLEELQAGSRLDVSSEAVTDAVLAELDDAAADGRPFFLFAHYFDPHYDYLPPAPFDEAFDPGYEGDVDGTSFYYGAHISRPDPDRPGKRIRVVSERDLDHVRALYAGELAWTDAEIGRILDRLDRLGLSERTLVVVTADHGDEFFEHGSIGHRLNLFEESVRVPLLLRLPGVLPAGRRADGLVANTDVLPTVLDLLGVPAPPDTASRSFLSLATGDADGSARHVVGRVVAMHRSSIAVPDADEELDALLVQVVETYRHGAIKITRERSWRKPLRPLPEAWRERVEREQRAAAAAERLVWIDVEAWPDEPPEAHASDFDDPRAHAALERFRAAYDRMLALRGAGSLRETDADVVAQLQGLGYASADAGGDPIGPDEFLLPPPGEHLPR